MKRKDVLNLLKYAGYHNDTKSFVRLFCENRISRKIADEAFMQGVAAKENGIKCTCKDCNPA